MKDLILADIEKTFLQLSVREEDRDANRFLWLEDPQKTEIFKPNIRGMKLQEFFCSKPIAIRSLPAELLAKNQKEIKVLGIPWTNEEDEICFRLKKFAGKHTKRNILAHIAKIYDPLGIDNEDEEDKEMHCFTDASGKGLGVCHLHSESNPKTIANLVFCQKPGEALQHIRCCGNNSKNGITIHNAGSEVVKPRYADSLRSNIWSLQTILRTWPSRGTTPRELSRNSLWKHGPKWLSEEKARWPKPAKVYHPDEEKLRGSAEDEETKTAAVMVELEKGQNRGRLCLTLDTFGGKKQIQWKFIANSEQNESKKALEQKTRAYCQCPNYVHPNIGCYGKHSNNFQRRKKTMENLRLFKDKEIWRCRGRIGEATVKEETKFPIFLPPEAWTTKLIVLEAHWKMKHPSHSTLLGRPALTIFGPLTIKGGVKVYIALYTCLVIRAVHLEVADDCTATEFLRTFRRFSSRRGLPSLMWSDNCTNFIAGAECIKEEWRREILVETSHSGSELEIPTLNHEHPGKVVAWERLVGITRKCVTKNSGGKKPNGKARIFDTLSEKVLPRRGGYIVLVEEGEDPTVHLDDGKSRKKLLKGRDGLVAHGTSTHKRKNSALLRRTKSKSNSSDYHHWIAQEAGDGKHGPASCHQRSPVLPPGTVMQDFTNRSRQNRVCLQSEEE
ncbi:hypothetical protein niasHT_020901 [Heterodera trifolii]|uniref:Integrase catalytic domain-containing protein n=1 Tax=Heterodera trifolii TaxID=157864 RepID=A0ABD2KS15_9BILA